MTIKSRYILSIIATFGLIFGITSCSEESDCSMTARPSMVSNFYKYGASKNIILKDTLPTLTVKALETDSILLNAGQKLSTFNAPLRYRFDKKEDVTAIIFQFSETPSSNDTLWIAHKNTQFFVSIDCGMQLKQEITKIEKYTNNTIDKVVLTNSEANNHDRENIKIILR